MPNENHHHTFHDIFISILYFQPYLAQKCTSKFFPKQRDALWLFHQLSFSLTVTKLSENLSVSDSFSYEVESLFCKERMC